MKLTPKGRAEAKAAKRAEVTENLREAAKNWNAKSPAEKKAARKWGGKK